MKGRGKEQKEKEKNERKKERKLKFHAEIPNICQGVENMDVDISCVYEIPPSLKPCKLQHIHTICTHIHYIYF